jgi:uncharacterized protein DUF4175
MVEGHVFRMRFSALFNLFPIKNPLNCGTDLTMNNYEWLISRLDAFIRKYYANKVIRGSLVFLSCLLFYILSVSISEYFLYLPVWSRITIDSLFVALGLSSLVAWVIIPLAKMGRLGKVISHEQAANIIGRHFPEISDRLLNILQLRRHPDNNSSRELAEASITQKIGQISVVPITKAIDLSKNRKYLPYLLPLVLAGVFILVAAPNVFREGSSRLLQPTKAFEKPSPFLFTIKNPSLIALRNADFTITVETKGIALPQEAFIEIGSERVPMQPLESHAFQYTFKNVTEQVNFRFYAAGFYSSSNTLKVVQRPVLKSFKVQINYPAYIGKPNETRTSLSDMTLPVGTTVTWALVTDHTDGATIHFGAGTPVALNNSSSLFSYQYRFLNDTAYTITLNNKAAGVADSYRYQVQVIPDQFPVIQVQQFKDTVSGKQILLTGSAGDDYGITRVSFNYEISDKNKPVLSKSIPVKIAPGSMATFQQYFDIQSLNLQPGQKLTYYIEAWDNDGVHGSKASRSEVMSFLMYDEKQIDSAINENSKQINSGISNSASKTQQLQSDYKDAQTKMLQSNNLDWEQQQSLQEMMKKQMDLKTNVENIKQRFEEQMQQSEQKKYSDNLKDKQKELDKQLDNLLNSELKEQLKKLQDLMQKLNKEQAVDAMKQMEQENKLFKMDMERMQELMKKYEMQMRMEDMANKMDELAKKERDLESKTDNLDKNNKDLAQTKDPNKDAKDKDAQGNKKDDAKTGKDAQGKDQKDGAKDKDAQAKEQQAKDALSKEKETAKTDDKELSKEQKDIKDQLDKAMKEELKEAQKLAKDLKENDKLDDEAKKGEDASKDMQDSKERLDQKQNDKAGKSQNKAAKNLEDMAKSLRDKAGEEGPEEIEIDIKATRQILSNLIRLSFDQEDLMQEVKHTSPSSQAYITNQEEQNRLHHNSQMVRDSMFALSKRVFKLATTINKETTELEHYMQKSVDALEGRNIGAAVTDEQYVMTHTNNLALMLNEVLTNLMQMQNEGKKQKEGDGSGSCTKPGSKPGNKPGKPGKNPGKGPGSQLSDIITEQKKLGDGLQKMQEDQANKQGGKKPGPQDGQQPGQKPGQKPGQGQKPGAGQNGQGDGDNEYGDAEQLARLAEQQASIRRKIQELSSQLNSKGMGNSKELREIEQKMDKTETDLVNRRLGSDLLQRQKDIQTRLLEAEKSLREQEQDDKRASNTGKEMSRPVPPALQKYITDQKQLLELYKTVPPQLKPYYREMVESYFHIIGNK